MALEPWLEAEFTAQLEQAAEQAIRTYEDKQKTILSTQAGARQDRILSALTKAGDMVKELIETLIGLLMGMFKQVCREVLMTLGKIFSWITIPWSIMRQGFSLGLLGTQWVGEKGDVCNKQAGQRCHHVSPKLMP